MQVKVDGHEVLTGEVGNTVKLIVDETRLDETRLDATGSEIVMTAADLCRMLAMTNAGEEAIAKTVGKYRDAMAAAKQFYSPFGED